MQAHSRIAPQRNDRSECCTQRPNEHSRKNLRRPNRNSAMFSRLSPVLPPTAQTIRRQHTGRGSRKMRRHRCWPSVARLQFSVGQNHAELKSLVQVAKKSASNRNGHCSLAYLPLAPLRECACLYLSALRLWEMQIELLNYLEDEERGRFSALPCMVFTTFTSDQPRAKPRLPRYSASATVCHVSPCVSGIGPSPCLGQHPVWR